MRGETSHILCGFGSVGEKTSHAGGEMFKTVKGV